MPTTSDRLIIFDVETTGTDRRRDQVIELCVQFGFGQPAASKTWRIKPSVSIRPGAQAVHGISADDLADCPSFAHVAAEFRAIFDEAQVLVGYNLGFDIEMLQAEYERLGEAPLEVGGKHIVDPFRLWQQCEPRTLVDAHKRFVGESFESAHSAAADVEATGRVLLAMVDAFGLRGNEWSAVAAVCEPSRERWIGPSRHLCWTDDGLPSLAFGKHTGAGLHQLANSEDGGYLRWIMKKDFPPHVHDICARAFELDRDDLVQWIGQTYGGQETG